MNQVLLKLKLGKLIKENLRKKGLRQLDLAKHLQVSTSAVSQMINGKTAPTIANLNRIFKFLNCNHNQILVMQGLFSKIRSGIISDLEYKKFHSNIPDISTDDLLKFNPALEDFKTFISQNYNQGNETSSFALTASKNDFDPLVPGAVILDIDIENSPDTNNIVVAKAKGNDKLQLKTLLLENNQIYLMPFIGIAEKKDSIADNLEWVRKVLKVTVKGS